MLAAQRCFLFISQVLLILQGEGLRIDPIKYGFEFLFCVQIINVNFKSENK